MRIGVVAPLARIGPDGPEGYMGIERACFWLANELVARKHEVLLFGNVDDGPSRFGWTGVRIVSETDVFSPEKLPRLQSCDAVSEWTHAKIARFARLRSYRATVMWTDNRDEARRNIYPSQAVREAFKDTGGEVVPIGIPVAGLPPVDGTTETAGPWLCLGRVAPYKGQDLAIRVAEGMGVALTVAGHTGQFADAYFSLRTRESCRRAGFGFVPDPPDLEALIGPGCPGLLHLHRWNESFSIVAAQALVRGVPVLTTDVGAVQEWVRACDGGMVVPLKDLEAGRWEAAGVRDFFETKWKGRRAGIAKRARELFDIRHVADRYLEILGGGK